ncbi:MAG: DUF721 domain-containing protein [Candidatus Omnitrophica bacterium]|nr:DUF721 domain-containing protein [Candidatus Omnitrophota bacterium]
MNKDNAPLKDVLKGLIDKIEKKEGGRDVDFFELWKGAVGKDASEHTKPKNLRSGKLSVNVSDSSRLYELTLKKNEIIRRLNKQLKTKKIKEIRFRIGEI